MAQTGTESAVGSMHGVRLTSEQKDQLFAQIVYSADVMARMAREAAPSHGTEAGYSFNMLRHLAERIGALAELPIIDEGIVGGVAAWCLGHPFDGAAPDR